VTINFLDAWQRRRRANAFARIFAENSWGSAESVSGPGSSDQRTSAFRDELPPLFVRLGVQTLLDAPCGEFGWVKHVTADLRSYVGVDIVPTLVERNRRDHGDAIHRFLQLDLVVDMLPDADLILCRDCLVHLSFADCRRALRNFRRTRARFLLATTFTGLKDNADGRTGGWRPLNLERSPFLFPRPLALIDERRPPAAGVPSGKSLALWNLAELPG
jgi:hypothetical protein